MIIHPWKSKIQSILDLHQQWWFLERIFLKGKVQFVGEDFEWVLHVLDDLYTPKSIKINILDSG